MKGSKWVFRILLVVLISFAVLVFANWVKAEGLSRSLTPPLPEASTSLPVIRITLLLASDGSVQGESLAIGKVTAGTNSDFFWTDRDGVACHWRGPVILQPTSYWAFPDRWPDSPFIPNLTLVEVKW